MLTACQREVSTQADVSARTRLATLRPSTRRKSKLALRTSERCELTRALALDQRLKACMKDSSLLLKPGHAERFLEQGIVDVERDPHLRKIAL